MSSVSFGDRPASNIAITALRKTAAMRRHLHPQASETILKNSYVDDIADSVEDSEAARKLTEEVDELLKQGGFSIKKWIFTCKPDNAATKVKVERKVDAKNSGSQKILGMKWDPVLDVFTFDVRLNFSTKRKHSDGGVDLCPVDLSEELPLTKRMILSQINRVYDPMGLAGLFTINAKIMMRQLWNGEAKSLGWDDVVLKEHIKEWISFFRNLFCVRQISFARCIKPVDAVGKPSMVVFCDGSNDACAYIRWQKADGYYESHLLASKNRITPLKRITIVRSELCGAVMGKRLSVFIKEEMRFEFEKQYFIVDSQIVQSMIQKDSYGFNNFVAVRIGEIQEETSPDDWYWMEGCNNISDLVTRRGKTPKELDEGSLWQSGPAFMGQSVEEWPIRVEQHEELPEQIKVVMMLQSSTKLETLATRINIDRFSSYWKLIRVTGRVLAMYKREPKISLKNACKRLTCTDGNDAEKFWFLEAQMSLKEQLQRGDYKRLCPRTTNDGIVVVGGRAEKWFQYRYDKEALILLPYDHQVTKLYCEAMHNEGGHLARSATVSKFRSNVWIPRIQKLVQHKFLC